MRKEYIEYYVGRYRLKAHTNMQPYLVLNYLITKNTLFS